MTRTHGGRAMPIHDWTRVRADFKKLLAELEAKKVEKK